MICGDMVRGSDILDDLWHRSSSIICGSDYRKPCGKSRVRFALCSEFATLKMGVWCVVYNYDDRLGRILQIGVNFAS
jgi:hypothetical protein